MLASARAGRPLLRALLRLLRPRLRRSSRRSRWSPSLLFPHRRPARRRALRRVAPHPRLALSKHLAVGPRAVATGPGAPSAPARAFLLLLGGTPTHRRSQPSRHPGPFQSPPTLLPGRGLPRSADPPVGSVCALPLFKAAGTPPPPHWRPESNPCLVRRTFKAAQALAPPPFPFQGRTLPPPPSPSGLQAPLPILFKAAGPAISVLPGIHSKPIPPQQPNKKKKKGKKKVHAYCHL